MSKSASTHVGALRFANIRIPSSVSCGTSKV